MRTYQVPLKYSQNFIKSKSLVQDLINKSNLTLEDTVLEIGPGNGIITSILSRKVKKLIVVEKDKILFNKLQFDLKDCNNLTFINQDFLKYQLQNIEAYKVFSNIPFSISSEIIKKLFFFDNSPILSYLIVQKEVALKMIGKPLSQETQTSLILKPFFNTKIIYSFKSSDFSPQPSVEVVLIEIKKISNKALINFNKSLYKQFIVFAYNQWKPNIRSIFRKIFSNLQLKILATNLNFSIESKPSDLSFEIWISLFLKFMELVPPYKQKLISDSEVKSNINHLKMRKENFNRINFN